MKHAKRVTSSKRGPSAKRKNLMFPQAPHQITNKDAFSKRLNELLKAYPMTQSELAKRIWDTYEDNRGRIVAKNRDLISDYCLGKSLPNREVAEQIAKALGVSVEELLPRVNSHQTQE